MRVVFLKGGLEEDDYQDGKSQAKPKHKQSGRDRGMIRK